MKYEKITLYLNPINADEYLILQYLKDKNKNATFKRAILNEIKNINFTINEEINNNDILDKEETSNIFNQ